LGGCDEPKPNQLGGLLPFLTVQNTVRYHALPHVNEYCFPGRRGGNLLAALPEAAIYPIGHFVTHRAGADKMQQAIGWR
jgi:hypothetical protein